MTSDTLIRNVSRIVFPPFPMSARECVEAIEEIKKQIKIFISDVEEKPSE